jgi:ProP effector
MTIRKENIHLATRYPRAFALEKYRPHRPLKVGVADDILACCPDVNRRRLGAALAVYTRRVMYLRGLVAGAARVDLDGNVCGEVSAGEAECAAAILASREARRIAAAEAKGLARVARQTATMAGDRQPRHLQQQRSRR